MRAKGSHEVLYRLLGPLEVLRDGAPVELGSPKQRAVLAMLLLDRGHVVSVDRLVEVVWGEHAPPSAVSGLQVYVSNLRRALRDEQRATSPIVRRAPGYLVDVPGEDVDVSAFLRDADAARTALDAHRWDDARTAAEQALARWRGPLLADLGDDPWVRAEAAALEERRTGVRETLLTALLGAGLVPDAVAEGSRIRSEHPLREHSTWLHLVALHRAGRSPEALEALRRYTAHLDEELGLEPGMPLRELQQAILRQDPALLTWPRPPDEARRPVAGPPQNDPGPAADVAGPTHGVAGPTHGVAGPTHGVAGSARGVASPRGGVASPSDGVAGPSEIAPVPQPTTGGLIGRGRQVEELERMLEEVRGGRARWTVLTGPPGIGKTRLADEAAARFRAGGGQDVWARCPEDEGTPAWWPLRQVVRALGADPDDVLVPQGDVDADASRFAVYERVHQVLAEAAAQGPRLVVVDDVQWADPTSLGCLAFLAGTLPNLPLAVVLTMRDGEAGPPVQRMMEALTRAGARRMAVPPLTAADVSTLANDVASEPFTASEAFLLAERTGGNPLFVSEYARLPRQERLGDGIPTAVRAVLGRRLAGLDAGVLQVLRTAAVIGDVLDIDLLATATRMDRDTLADLLDEAADEHIIVPAAGGGGYAFAHGLLREEVLAGVSGLRRQRLHARVAEALGPGADGDRLGRRAQHLLAALPLVDAVDALDACRAAALDAEDRWNSESAAAWWAFALEAFDLLPPDVTLGRPADERDDLLIAHLTALAGAGRGRTLLETVESRLLDAVREGRTATAGRLAATLLRGTGAWPWATYGGDGDDRHLLARLHGVLPFVQDDPAAHVRVLAALAVGSHYEPDVSVAADLSARALELAEQLGDPDVLADALLARGLAYSGVSGQVHRTIELMERLGGLGHRQARTDDALRHSLLSLAWLTLGDGERVGFHARQATAISDVMRLPVIRTQMRWIEVTIAMWRGDHVEARRLQTVASGHHAQTELYTRGAEDLSFCILRWRQGRLGEVDVAALGVAEPLVWEAVDAASAGQVARASALVAEHLAARTAPNWTTLGHLVVLAHVVADLALSEHASALHARLLPDEGHLANIGQIGMIGPVDTALSRLELLLGRDDDAGRHAAAAARLTPPPA